MTDPESCPHRVPTASENGATAYTCDFARQLIGLTESRSCRVEQEVCRACCSSLSGPGNLNPVVASVVYGIASRIIGNGGEEGCTAEHAGRIRSRVRNHLDVVLAELPQRSFPPRLSFDAANREATPPAVRQWAIAMLTSPRRVPTIERTLKSLQQAQLYPDVVLAEPKALIPPRLPRGRVIVHDSQLGNYRNFYLALTTLWENFPDAECFCIVQDDIEIAKDAKAWCDGEFWPLGAGLVSLFTPKLHAADATGWRLRFPGFHRVYGGQALVFRRDVLQEFLADPQVYGNLRRRRDDDAVVSGWATRRGIGIAYHTPSLVRHIGESSALWPNGPDRRVTADAVSDVARLVDWHPTKKRDARIALLGYNAPTGLGYQNRELAAQLPIDRWIIRRCVYAPFLPKPDIDSYVVPRWNSDRQLSKVLKGCDWLLFAEQPVLPNAAVVANQMGMTVACIPNWEVLRSDHAWLANVDLMICPTRHTYLHLCDWKSRYSFGWDVVHVPWPIEVESFEFRLRPRCERFVFINGWQGSPARDAWGRTVGYNRKGLQLVVEAARLAPHIPFVVYSQYSLGDRDLPRNMEVKESPASRTDLYLEGDVCVQPSHWEGVGLQFLECQAAGMPLITTAAPPMNEYNALATIPVKRQELIQGPNGACYCSNVMDPADLVDVLERFHGQDIAEASRAARRFVETERNWSLARERILPHLVRHQR